MRKDKVQERNGKRRGEGDDDEEYWYVTEYVARVMKCVDGD